MHVAIISHKNGSSYGGSSSIILEHRRWNLAKNNKIRSVWKSTPKYLFIRDGALCEFVADNTSHNTTRYPVDLYSIKVKSSALVSLCFDWTSYNKHKKLLYFVATLLLMWGSRIQSHITTCLFAHILSANSLEIQWIATHFFFFFSYLPPGLFILQQLPELLPPRLLLWMAVFNLQWMMMMTSIAVLNYSRFITLFGKGVFSTHKNTSFLDDDSGGRA